jgi:hypothetical protein
MIALVLCGGIWAWNHFMPAGYQSPHAYFIVIYFALLTWIIRGMGLRIHERSPKDFVRFFMGSTALRLFLHLIVILIYGLANRAGAVHFIMAFLAIYFVFLIFEVATLNRSLRKNGNAAA